MNVSSNMPFAKSSPPMALVLAAVVALITTAVVGNATTTLAMPNAASVSYSLAPGANTGAITPATGRAVHLMGVQTTVGWRGVGQVTILVPAAAPQFIEWTGQESPPSATITSGYNDVVGTHIVYLDYGHSVEVEVNSATTIRVHNGAGYTAAGNLTLIW